MVFSMGLVSLYGVRQFVYRLGPLVLRNPIYHTILQT